MTSCVQNVTIDKNHQSSTVNRRRGRMDRSAFRSLAALASLIVLADCQAETAPLSGTDRPVQVERVTLTAPDAAREFVGVVRARYETDLGFRVGGKIVARLVNVGDRVHAGDIVAKLHPQDLKRQVETAEDELDDPRS